MDLDALKTRINDKLEQPVTVMSRTVVCKVPRSRGLLMKLRRNLWMEMAFYLLSVPIMLFEAWRTEERSLSIYLVTCAVVMTLLTPVFVRLARRITLHIHQDHTVHEGLKELLDIMKTYHRRYLQFNLIMVPMCLVYSIALVISFPGPELTDGPADPIQLSGWQIGMIFIGGLVILMTSTWFIAKWWIHWLYGRFICDLEKELNEVETTE